MLSDEQKLEFENQGFIVLPDFKSINEIAKLKQRALDIAGKHDLSLNKEIFSTDKNKGPQADKIQDYFLGSANDIKCFFEEKAFDKNGNLIASVEQCINKIGHAMHDLDDVFYEFSHGHKLAELAADLGLEKPLIWQSMYIFKNPKIGGEVCWHQDTGYFMTEPQSVITFWFAIDDASLENGCLWVKRGGHKSSLREKFIRDGNKTKIIKLSNEKWPNLSDAVPVEVKSGSLVCFNGLLPHYSAPNKSDRPRNAYTLHVTNACAKYSEENWIQRPEDFPARGFV